MKVWNEENENLNFEINSFRIVKPIRLETLKQKNLKHWHKKGKNYSPVLGKG